MNIDKYTENDNRLTLTTSANEPTLVLEPLETCLFQYWSFYNPFSYIMDLTADLPVTLVVKAANQRIADQTVECVLGWTVRKLKRHLENVYPSKPVS